MMFTQLSSSLEFNSISKLLNSTKDKIIPSKVTNKFSTKNLKGPGTTLDEKCETQSIGNHKASRKSQQVTKLDER